MRTTLFILLAENIRIKREREESNRKLATHKDKAYTKFKSLYFVQVCAADLAFVAGRKDLWKGEMKRVQ